MGDIDSNHRDAGQAQSVHQAVRVTLVELVLDDQIGPLGDELLGIAQRGFTIQPVIRQQQLDIAGSAGGPLDAPPHFGREQLRFAKICEGNFVCLLAAAPGGHGDDRGATEAHRDARKPQRIDERRRSMLIQDDMIDLVRRHNADQSFAAATIAVEQGRLGNRPAR